MNKKILKDTIILINSYESIDETKMEYIFGALSDWKAFCTPVEGED